LSDAEAAEVLGCTRSAYAMRLTRAKRRLVEMLGRSGSPDGVENGTYRRIAEDTI